MSLKGHEEFPKTPNQELQEKVKSLSEELAQVRSELSTAKDRAVKAEQERDALKAKKPEADPETVKRLKAAEAENAELRRKAKENDELLKKADDALKKAETRVSEAEARAAVAEAKKPEVAASAPEAEKFDIRIDLLTTKERDEYFEKRSQWAADDRTKAEARKEYLRSLAEKIADRV